MRNLWLYESQSFMLIGVQFILGIVICSCNCSSSIGANRFPDATSDVKSTILFPFPERFIMKSFFPKHDSWSGLHLRDFLRHKASIVSKPTILRLSVAKRGLIGEGFHRRLFSSLTMNAHLESIPDLFPHSCKIIVIESLPLGVYADPFELERLHHRDGFKDAAVFGDTDLELPTILSRKSLVEIHLDVGINMTSIWDGVKIDMELPLHARYPPVEESGYVRMKFSVPEILVSCGTQNRSEFLIWVDGEDLDGAVVWDIACGLNAHAGVVSFFTFASAFLCALLLIAFSFSSSHSNQMHTKSKHL